MNIKKNNSISIIIPLYNEIDIIDKLIENLKQFKDSCEIIFVDGGSSDGTDELIKKTHRLVYSPKKGRANQMNYGASKSKGQILLFLHADSILSSDAIDHIDQTISSGNKVGCFKIKFNSRNIFMKICGRMSNLRVSIRNIAFGDQGIFISRDYFYELGGFPAIPLMEDYKLSMNIKADGQKIALAKTKIITSERRFVETGRLKAMAKMQKLQYMYRRGKDIEVIANLYK